MLIKNQNKVSIGMKIIIVTVIVSVYLAAELFTFCI